MTDKRRRFTCGRRRSHGEYAEALSAAANQSMPVVVEISAADAGPQNGNATNAADVEPQSVQGRRGYDRPGYGSYERPDKHPGGGHG